MTEKEHKDVYIAAAVGGLGLVLVLLYLFGGSQPASAATNADGTPLPGVAAVAPPGVGTYNYNITPYNPDPLLPYAKSAINPLASGGGCCDTCGPIGAASGSMPPNVAQYQTLMGTGAG